MLRADAPARVAGPPQGVHGALPPEARGERRALRHLCGVYGALPAGERARAVPGPEALPRAAPPPQVGGALVGGLVLPRRQPVAQPRARRRRRGAVARRGHDGRVHRPPPQRVPVDLRKPPVRLDALVVPGGVVHPEPPVWIARQDELKHVEGVVVVVVRLEVWRERDVLLAHLADGAEEVVVAALHVLHEGPLPSKQLEHQDAKRPYVCEEVVALPVDHLRGHVLRRAAHGVHRHPLILPRVHHVPEINAPILTHKDVFQFQVAVHVSTTVHVLQSE
mmetsp:Transcript_23708/g.51778  ORF Transcript_23708/g.51778 Transcript_23708/m.51778 type:complete len:278 (+) Transcript_23708:382-1215(+)